MIETSTGYYQIIFLVGAVIVLNIFIKALSHRLQVPAIVGYMLVGLGLKIMDQNLHILNSAENGIFGFLAEVGIITLLFRIGLESNVHGLLRQLKNASLIWFMNVSVCGLLGFICAHYGLDIPLVPSLMVGVAFTATSVGISVGVWKEMGAIRTPAGELLIDVAELDDISGIILMAMLFAVLPCLRSADNSRLLMIFTRETVLVLIKLIGFGVICALLSIIIERYVLVFFRRMETLTQIMLMVTGFGFIIASWAGIFGFSAAIGAFFAGLIFCRDKDAVKIDASFDTLDELFSPFFFVGIGLSINPDVLTQSVILGVIFILIAAASKIVSVTLPARLMMPWSAAAVLGVSMVPRAEIALIIMQRGMSMGEEVVPAPVFNAMVMVTTVTCLVSPFAIGWMLKKWPPTAGTTH